MIAFSPEFPPEIRANRERLANIIGSAITRAEEARVDEPNPADGETSKYALLLFGTEVIHEIYVTAGPLIWGSIDLENSRIRIATRPGPEQQDAARIMATRGGFPQPYAHESVIRPVLPNEPAEGITPGTVARWDTEYDLSASPEGNISRASVAAMSPKQLKALDLQILSSSPFARSYRSSLSLLVHEWRKQYLDTTPS